MAQDPQHLQMRDGSNGGSREMLEKELARGLAKEQ